MDDGLLNKTNKTTDDNSKDESQGKIDEALDTLPGDLESHFAKTPGDKKPVVPNPVSPDPSPTPAPSVSSTPSSTMSDPLPPISPPPASPVVEPELEGMEKPKVEKSSGLIDKTKKNAKKIGVGLLLLSVLVGGLMIGRNVVRKRQEVIMQVSVDEYIGSGKYDDNNPVISYSGDWVEENNELHYGGRLHACSVSDCEATVNFDGDRIIVIFSSDSSQGVATIMIDEEEYEVNQDRGWGEGKVAPQRRWISPKLNNGEHSLTIKPNYVDGKVINIDAIEVNDPPAVAADKWYELDVNVDTSPGLNTQDFQFSGKWHRIFHCLNHLSWHDGDAVSTGYFAGSDATGVDLAQRKGTQGANVTFSFYGKQLWIYFGKGSQFGEFGVEFDGKTYGTVSEAGETHGCYSPGQVSAKQETQGQMGWWYSPVLDQGVHTVVVHQQSPTGTIINLSDFGPISNTEGWLCGDISSNPDSPALTDDVTYTCTGIETLTWADRPPSAFFRYNVDGGAFTESGAVEIDLENGQANYDINIDQTGDWLVQCRVCDTDASNCTAWGQAN